MRPRRSLLEILEHRRVLAAEIHQAGYFATWNANPRIIPSTDPADIGYNPRTGHLMISDSEIEELSQFQGENMFEVSLKGDVLYGAYASDNDEPTGVVWNDFIGHWVVCNDDSKQVTIYSDDFSQVLLERDSTLQDDEGITVDNATGAMYIIDGHDGDMRVIKINTNLIVDPNFGFSVATGFLTDAEGIAFHQATQTLFVQGGKKLAQFSLDGQFLQGWDMSTGFSPPMNTPQGAVFAPTSDPNDSPNALAMYISDGGNDNFPDGGIYEVTFTGLIGGNLPPTVNAGPDQVVSAALPASTTLAGSFNDDGLPAPPGTVTRTWSVVSGPGIVTFANANQLNTTATFSLTGNYVLRLTASDSEYTVHDTVNVSVNVATVQRRITVGSDDAEQASAGTVAVNGNDLELVLDGTSTQTVGLRFTSMNVPRGAFITNAYLQFQADEVKTAATSLTIQGQAADNPTTFTTAALNISNRPRTAASVAWTPTPWSVVGREGVDERSPSLTAIVQELVNRPGWNSGNAMAMIVTGSGVRTARSFEGLAAGAPLLYVEYSTAPNSPPVVNAGPDQNKVLQNLSSTVSLAGSVTDDNQPFPVNLTSQWSKLSGPGTVTFGNAAATSTTAMFSAVGTYVLRLTGNDSLTSSVDDVTITVALNQPPVVNAGIDKSEVVASFSSPVSLSGSATDDGHPQPPNLTHTWSLVGGPGTVTFANANAATTTAQFSTNGSYTLRLTSNDGWATGTDDVAVTVTLNQAPVVGAGDDQSVLVNSLTTGTNLLGTLTDDLLPAAATLLWSQVSGPGTATFGSATTLGTSVTFSAVGSYLLRLTANDGLAAPASDDVTVTITLNGAPVVSAGPDYTNVFISSSTPVSLHGSASDDGLPAPPTLTSQWTQVSGPGTVTFADAANPTTTATFSVLGDYVLRLTSNDGLAQSHDDVTIALRSNVPPTADAGLDKSVLLSDLSTQISIMGLVSDDGLPAPPTLTSLWTLDTGPGTVTFGNAASAATTAQFSAAGTYVLRLTANDGLASHFDTVTVIVTLGVDLPPVVSAGPDLNQVVNSLSTSFNLNGSATDEGLPYPPTLTSLWTKESGPDGSSVTFASATSPVTTAQFSAPGTYVLRLTATDGLTPSFDETTVVVTLNAPPVVSGGGNQNAVVNSLATPVNLNGSATDDGVPGVPLIYTWTKESGPGTVTFGDATSAATTAVFSAVGSYVLRLTATDGLNLSGHADVTINVALNTPPVANAGADRTITGGFPVSTTLQGTSSDDGLPGVLTTTWTQVNGPGPVTFTNAAVLNTSASFPTVGTYILRLTATDGSLVVTDDVIYSVVSTPTVLDRRINLGSDDAEQQPNGTVDIASSDIELVVDGTIVQPAVGLRFSALTIPSGVTITNAYVQFTTDEVKTAAASLTIRGQAADNAVTFANTANNITSRPVTTASVGWNPAPWPTVAQAGVDQRTPDLSAIIQEIINRPGWASNNAIALIVTGSGVRTARSFNGQAAQAPLLHIEYANFPPPNVPPAANAGADQNILVNSLATGASLAGSGSDDGFLPPSLQWTKTSGPGDVTFADATLASTTANFSAVGTYVLRLTANDGLQTHFDEMQVVVGLNQAPIVSAGADQNVIVASLATGVNLAGTLSDDLLPAAATVQWTQVDGPGTTTFGDATALTTSATFSAAGTYVLRLTANDGFATPVSDEVSITITVNLAPVVNAGTDQIQAYINASTPISLSGTVSDDGQPAPPTLTSTWTKVSGPETGVVTYADASSPITTATFSELGDYVLRLTTTDGAATTQDDVAISLRTNVAPVVNAGVDISAVVNSLATTVAIAGVIMDDGLPVPASVTSVWTKVSGPLDSTVTFGNASLAATTAQFSAAGTYVLQLTANDGLVSTFDEVQVVVALNQAPIVGAGLDQSVAVNSLATGVNLAGTLTDDLLPTTATLLWTQITGPGTTTFGNAAALTTSATFSAVGTYVLRLAANDGLAPEASDEVSITVSLNTAPLVNAGADQIQAYINASTPITLSGTVTDDGLPAPPNVTSTWTKVSGPETGVVTFANASSPTTTATFSELGDYVLRLTANDGLATTLDEVTISLRTNAPPLVDAGLDKNAVLSILTETVSIIGVISDDGLPTPANLTSLWTKVSGPVDSTVTFGNAGSAATTAQFSAAGTYVLRLTANDGLASNFDEVQVVVALNQAPIVSAGADQSVAVNSLASSANLVGTLTDDALPTAATLLWTQVSGPGTATFGNAAALTTTATFSAVGTYVLRLTANDGLAPAVSDEVSINVAINTAPIVNAGADQIQAYINASTPITLSGTVTDDGLPAPPNVTSTWTKVSGPGTGVIIFANASSPATTATFSELGDYVLRLTSNDGLSTTFDEVAISLRTNAPPVVDAGLDRTAVLSVLSDTVSLLGVISDDGLPTPANLTSLWTKVSGPLDSTVTFGNVNSAGTTAQFSAAGTYVLRLTANDGLASNFDEVQVVVALNQAPIVGAGADQSVAVNSLATGVNLVGTLTDDALPAAASLLWTQVSGPGTATFGNAAALTTTATFSAVGTYILRLTGNDGLAPAVSDEVSITIALNAAPLVNAGADQVQAYINASTSISLAGLVSDDGLPAPPNVTSTWTKVSGPETGIVTFANASSPTTTATFSELGDYVLRLTANDGLSTTFDEVTISLRTNAPPVVDAGLDKNAVLSVLTDTVSIVGVASDDGLPTPANLTTLWTMVSGPLDSTVTFASANSAATTAQFSHAGTYVLRLTANDGLASTLDEVQVVVAVNQAPIVGAGPDQTVTVNSLATGANLAGTLTDDLLPSAATLLWTQVSGPGTATFGNAAALTTTATFSAAGTYVLRLTANDGLAAAVSDEVSITVVLNAAPIVNAGPDQIAVYINSSTPISLAGSASDDGHPAPPNLTSTWTKVGGPITGVATFTDASSPTTTVTFSEIGDYVLRLTSTDGLATTFDEVTISLRTNAAPVADAGLDKSVLLSTLTTAISIMGLVSDDGLPVPPNVISVWSKTSGPDGSSVTFGNANSAATTAQFSHEGTYVLRLTANDGLLSHFDEVTVTVTLGVDNPPVVNAGPDLNPVLNTLVTPVSLAGSATDEGLPYPPTFTSAWTKESGPGTVTFASAASPATTAQFSAPGTYVLRLSASDGNVTTIDETTVVVALNTAPVVNAGTDQNVLLNSLTTKVSLSGSVSDDGLPPPPALTNSWSVTSGPGTVTFDDASSASTLAQFSATGTYVLKLSSSDGSLSSFDEVTIAVSLNGAPIVNAGPDQSPIFNSLTSTVSLSGTATDDGVPGALTTTWSQASGPGTTTFGNASLLATTAQFSAAGTYVLRLTANDGSASSFDEVTIAVTLNAAPVVNAGTDQNLVLNSLATPVNLSGSATDDGIPGTPLTYAWTKFSGPGTATFGDATFAATTATFSAAGTYVLRLTATDGLTNSGQDDVTITIALNAAPIVNAGVDQNLNGGFPLSSTLAGTATDDGLPSALTTTWSQVSGPATATITTPSSLNSPVSFPAAGTYVLKLAAFDGSLTTEDTVSFTVSNVVQPPTVFERRVSAGSDDAEQQPNGTVDLASSDIELIVDGTVVQPAVGIRFTSIAIPKGATITNAYVQFTTDEVKTAATSVTIRGQAADNPATFANTASNISSRPTTTASASWTPAAWPTVNQAGVDQRTSSIASIVQEIVNRPGWASGNALALIFTGSGVRTARAFEGAASQAALLRVEFTTTPVVNQPPVVNAGADQSISTSFPHTATLQGTLTDDGLPGLATALWSQVSGPATVTFGNASLVNSNATFPVAGTYVLRLTGNDGAASAIDEVTFTVSLSSAPVVNAGPDQSLVVASLATAVNLSGSATDDGIPGTPLTYAWTKFSGPGTVTFGDANLAVTTATFSAAGTYVLRLTSTDGLANSGHDDVTITVALNSAPVVNAGADQNLNGGLPVNSTLSGTASDDGFPGALTTTWSQVSGPAAAIITTPSALSSPVSFPSVGTYVLKLEVFDGLLTTEDTVTFAVSDVVLPPTVFERRINVGSDDAEQQPNGSVDLASSDIELTTDGTVAQPAVGLRFTSITIPKGATITNAYVQFTTDEVKTAAASLTIRGQAADNPATFANTTSNISSRPQTTASASWTPAAWPTVNQAGVDQRTSNVASIIQEIVNRTGWASGNSLALIFTGTGVRTARAFEGAGAQAALLHIEYTALPGINQPATVDAGPDEIISGSLPRTTTLQGAFSDDGLPAPAVVTWSQVSGPGTVAFGNPSLLNSTATFPVAGTYVLRLTADDGTYAAIDEVTFTLSSTPVGPTVINQRVTASSDDAEQAAAGQTNLTSSELELVADGASVQTVGLRFNALAIPQGSTITNAYLQFTADEVTTAASSLVVRGQAADNAATFAATNLNVSSRPQTTASVAWSPAAWPTRNQATAAQQSPDLAAIIQEIVNRSGWAPGNSLALIVTGSGTRTARAFDGGATTAPLLHIEFTPPSTSGFSTSFMMPATETVAAPATSSSAAQTLGTVVQSTAVAAPTAPSTQAVTNKTATSTASRARQAAEEVFRRIGLADLRAALRK